MVYRIEKKLTNNLQQLENTYAETRNINNYIKTNYCSFIYKTIKSYLEKTTMWSFNPAFKDGVNRLNSAFGNHALLPSLENIQSCMLFIEIKGK